MTQDNLDKMYMRRCIELAAHGLGRTCPNPMVGCVVVSAEGHVIGEGYHQEYGHWHAERNALLRLAGDGRLQGATLYVNLEPCAHHGKTPPCADLVAESGVKRVVCACDDPNPLVGGKGFERLRAAGIEVVRHILEDEGRELNRRFFTFMEQRRPYVILKWAESADGYMAPPNMQEVFDNARTYWLSTPQQNRLNHRWRTEEAAILVGSSTFLTDKPALTARHYVGPQPQPVVIDRRGRLACIPDGWLHLHTPTVEATLQALYQRQVQSVIVEGGRQVLDAFIASGLYDEVRVLRGAQKLGVGLKAPKIPSMPQQRLTIVSPDYPQKQLAQNLQP